MTNKVTSGEIAPDFTLPDANLNPVHLKDFQGKNVVLVFFVSAFTNTCTKEACSFRDLSYRLVDLDAQIIGISVNDPFTNRVFIEKNKLEFPILSDYNRKVIELYGLESHNFSGLDGYTVAKRSIFVLDKKGVIRYAWISDNSEKEPDYSGILQVLNTM